MLIGRNAFTTAEVLRGIAEIADLRHIALYPVESLHETGQSATRTSHAHGIILCRCDPDQLERVRTLQKPAVVLFDHDAARLLPAVLPDELAIGRLATEHLLDRGLRYLAFVGSHAGWSRLRLAGFLNTARERHATVLPPRIDDDWGLLMSTDATGEWLAGLPRPVGVFAANDELAAAVRDAAFERGLTVPEDVSVIGVDNNELRTRYSRVPLSSVNVDPVRIGRTAMQMLLPYVRRDDGALPPVEHRLVPPLGVVARRSTDVMAVNDPDVRLALKYIADHACRGIDVSDVLARVLVSRSSLDRRMKAALGRTCADEIARVRLMHARRLLRETDLPLSEVASACGYHYLSHFSHAFRKAMGVPPRVYRQASRNVTSGSGVATSGSGVAVGVARAGVDDGDLSGGRGVPTDGQPGGGKRG